jgi:hypothetical protein
MQNRRAEDIMIGLVATLIGLIAGTLIAAGGGRKPALQPVRVRGKQQR